MKNIRLTVEYDGTNYNGWQIQSRKQLRGGGRVKTIQGVLQDALFNIFAKRVNLISCSRTDSGVHARAHIANFRITTNLKSLQIKRALNSILPDDILIKDAEEVPLNFNAQYDALSKTYRYVICNREHISPFDRGYMYRFRQLLDVSLMKKEAKTLSGRHDFRAFKSAYPKGNRAKGAIDCKRTIKKLVIRKKNGIIEIDIEADGFLYNMVRNIVGTLIEIGRRKFPPGSMKKILKSKNRKLAGPTVPAKALFLIRVMFSTPTRNAIGNIFHSEQEIFS